ncbi:MAG: hypothetical protein R3B48_07625 [Kofleriaceae bacterium]
MSSELDIHLSEVSRRQMRGCWMDRAFLALVVVLAMLSVHTVELAFEAGNDAMLPTAGLLQR